MPDTLPHKIAVLCYLYDGQDRVLLLHRIREPNAGMYSPIGGKLDRETGESPHACAIREIEEEAGVRVTDDEVRLNGIISEHAYEGRTHWLIFLFEVTRPVGHDEIAAMEMREGVLEWVPREGVESLEIPETDRSILWPLVARHRGGFFMVDIDCRTEPITWRVQESTVPSPT
ncbi:MAG: NUDIX hydrolase [Planctomycetota bacterium]|jgi:8-oxo-dGTP diphosphatase